MNVIGKCGMGKYSKVRTRENYRTDKLSTKSQSTKNNFEVAIKSLDQMVAKNFKVKDFDKVLEDTLQIKEIEKREDEITDIIQDWVNLVSQTKTFNTIKVQLSGINKYLKYYKIKIIFSEEIEFPPNIQEARYPISLEEIQSILNIADYKQKAYYLCLITSGSRPVEIICLKKKNILWTGTRYSAIIPAIYTKKKMDREIFFSVECNTFLKNLLDKHTDDETIFTKNPILANARSIEGDILKGYVKKLGMDKKFDVTGYNKINLYCFRGYFFTKAIRVFNEDIAHSMIGHGAYQQVYQRRTTEEKEELYDELEPEILIYDQKKNTEKIKRLKEANEKLQEKDDRLERVESILIQVVKSKLVPITNENKKIVDHFLESHKS